MRPGSVATLDLLGRKARRVSRAKRGRKESKDSLESDPQDLQVLPVRKVWPEKQAHAVALESKESRDSPDL